MSQMIHPDELLQPVKDFFELQVLANGLKHQIGNHRKTADAVAQQVPLVTLYYLLTKVSGGKSWPSYILKAEIPYKDSFRRMGKEEWMSLCEENYITEKQHISTSMYQLLAVWITTNALAKINICFRFIMDYAVQRVCGWYLLPTRKLLLGMMAKYLTQCFSAPFRYSNFCFVFCCIFFFLTVHTRKEKLVEMQPNTLTSYATSAIFLSKPLLMVGLLWMHSTHHNRYK